MTALPDPYSQPQFYESVTIKRLVAWVVDAALIAIICVLILPFTAFTGLLFFPFLMLILGFAYRVITIANGSATWGMRFMAIELRRLDGSRFDFGTAVLHTLGYSISMGFPLLQVVSIVLMLTGARAQGLTDNMLGTVAINRRA